MLHVQHTRLLGTRKNMAKKDDIYIATLKFGKSKIGTPFLFSELEAHLSELGYVYDEFSLRQFFAAVFIAIESPGGNDQHQPINPKYHFFIETHGYFDLLQHEELKSARNSSLVATWIAIIAIFISFVSTGFSIYYANKQLESDITIEKNQFEELKPIELDSIITELKNNNIRQELNDLKFSINNKLDSLIEVSEKKNLKKTK